MTYTGKICMPAISVYLENKVSAILCSKIVVTLLIGLRYRAYYMWTKWK